jgi:XamI restriction endonuclease
VTPVAPPEWDAGQLERDRLVSIETFKEQRLQEPLEQYLEAFDTYRGVVEELLETTVDLTELSSTALEVLTDPGLLEALRYLAGPPISTDDLKVLADARLSTSALQNDPAMAERVVETVLTALDRRRFPWVREDREPEEAEREAAALASAALMATQRLSNARRSESKTAQEDAVRIALLGAGFRELPTRTMVTLAAAPSEGEFCPESMFGGRKADFVVGLWDGRKLPLECKVSNSATNSVKRLNNDAAVKASQWLREFGTAQTVPAAVLSGVFKRHNLEAAQHSGLALFWAHDLPAMLDWIECTRP